MNQFDEPDDLDDAEPFGVEPIEMPVEDHIDLHTFSPRDIKELIPEYLQQSHDHGFPSVRIIHGKGIGVQREIVHAQLARSPLVASFHDADQHLGATIAILKY